MTFTDKNNSGKKVVILGYSPLPFENVSKNYAPGARTWHFTEVALQGGAKVLLICYRIPKIYDKSSEPITLEKKDSLEYYSVDGSVFENKEWITRKIQEFNADCVVGVTTYPSSIVADLKLELPFWADLYGSVMAEAQSKAYLYQDDGYLNYFYKQEEKVLGKADIFSVVSEAQGFSLIGELGIWGRLNKDTMGYRFVRVIPATIEPKEFKHTKNVIREKLAKESDFVILYTGGYNTWTDVDTLFSGLEKAMSKNPQIVFVSTGGKLEGHDEHTYDNFTNMIQSSKYKERFHLCGWVPQEDLPNYYLEADLAINSDKFCYEALLGSRTRVLEWLCASLTFISTPLSEITNYLIENDLAYSFKEGNADDLAEKLLAISSDKEGLESKKQKLGKTLTEEFTYQATSGEFAEWLKNPQHSPDFKKMDSFGSKGKTDFKPPIHTSLTLAQHLAISSWPHIAKSLRIFGLGKYSEKVKRIGEKTVVQKPKKTIVQKLKKTVVNEAQNYRAEFLNVNLPEMESGKKYAIPVVIKNVGKATWENPSNPDNTINFSYIWKDTKGNVIVKSDERTSLVAPIKPGKKSNAEVIINTPPNDGEYVLQLDLVKEKYFWFSEIGSKKFEAPLKIKKKIINESMTTQLPLISIIIVTFNSEKFISECLDSILASDYPKMEVIAIDNGSTDNSVDKLSKYKDKIKVISAGKNLGFASGNNLGIKESNGEIIIFINPDVFVTKNSFRELVLPFFE